MTGTLSPQLVVALGAQVGRLGLKAVSMLPLGLPLTHRQTRLRLPLEQGCHCQFLVRLAAALPSN